MADVTTTAAGEPQALDRIGDRLREERVKAGISQRELARRLGLSASLISQLESGQSRPSVGTLYLIVTELGVSLDDVIRGEESARGRPTGTSRCRRTDRRCCTRRSGPRSTWTPACAGRSWRPIVRTGSTSSRRSTRSAAPRRPDRSLIRHQGREYGYIISGTLGVQIGFQEHVLSPGDSIAFDSTTPHRLFNVGDEPVHAIWFVVGRLEEHDHG